MTGKAELENKTRFSWLFEGDKTGPDSCFDQDLSNDELFALMPTAGSIVPGWLLAIPRFPVLSVSNLSPLDQVGILNFAQGASEMLADFGQYNFVFEHGPCSKDSLVGCGVDQAHLHIVTVEFDLLSLCLDDSSMVWKAVDLSNPWKELSGSENYYFISDMRSAYIGYPSTQTSQYFRRKIAQAVGVVDQWDYRLYPHKENAYKTVEHIARRNSSRNAA